MSHKIKIGDFRPLGKKNESYCSECGCTGKRNLNKFKTCEEFLNKSDYIPMVFGKDNKPLTDAEMNVEVNKILRGDHNGSN
jgi:hypothetical protein